MNSATRHVAHVAFVTLLAGGACTRASAPVVITPEPAAPRARADTPEPNGLGATTQLVVVTSASWDTTGGVLRRYQRAGAGERWRAVGDAVPVVLGRTGLAWDDAFVAPAGTPVKREGDGRAPAGVFALDRLFGFAPAAEVAWARLPYLPIGVGTECVDDVRSTKYNMIVDRAAGAVDWTSAEHMRAIGQYRLGVTVAYNTPPRVGRGSCIFLHIWGGPGTYTAGCTAMAERDLTALAMWLDGARRPVIVQLPDAEYARLRETWRLP